MKLGLALCWTLVLILDIADACTGGTPSWTAVFCPLSILVFDLWVDYLDAKVNGRKK